MGVLNRVLISLLVTDSESPDPPRRSPKGPGAFGLGYTATVSGTIRRYLEDLFEPFWVQEAEFGITRNPFKKYGERQRERERRFVASCKSNEY